MTKKGDIHFTTEQLGIIILFVIVLAVAILVIVPRIMPESFKNAIVNFLLPIYDALTGAKS